MLTLRNRLVLDGQWQIAFGEDVPDSKQKSRWTPVHVPGTWQSQFPDRYDDHGTAWYRRSFTIPDDWTMQCVVLRFDAVYYFAEVWLNGQLLGHSESGYFPFEFDITALVESENRLLVRVTMPNDDAIIYPDFPFSEILHGKQSWYGKWSGIWQSVQLENRPTTHIVDLQVQADLASRLVNVEVAFSKELGHNSVASISVLDPQGTSVVTQNVRPEGKILQTQLEIDQEIVQWSPSNPALYRLRVSVQDDHTEIDYVEKTFGFREIVTHNGQLYLNGSPLLLRGALDQDYYPETIASPPSIDLLEKQVLFAKQAGFNCIRVHIKIPDPRYYEVADRLGILIWADLPNWQHLSDRTRARVREGLNAMLKRDGHHPCIIIWTIVNEDWGTDLVDDANHRSWLKSTFDWFKEQDPTRLIVDNSACEPNYHIKTDIEDYHFYRHYPDHINEWDNVVDAFAMRADWTFSPHEDVERCGDEPLVISEFGTWGLPDIDNLLLDDGTEPWWFETGHGWGDGIVYPHGAKARFYVWSLHHVFDNWNNLIKSTQHQQYEGLKYQIESMRLHQAISGYVVTELTDVYWECNGLLDMERQPRQFADKLPMFNQDIVVVLRADRPSYWSGDTAEVEVVLCGLPPSMHQVRIHWIVEDTDHFGNTTANVDTNYEVQRLCNIPIQIPNVDTGTRFNLRVGIEDSEGRQVAQNYMEITGYPRLNGLRDCLIWSSSDNVTAYLSALGYQFAANVQDAHLIVDRQISPAHASLVRSGIPLLIVADHKDSLPQGGTNVVIDGKFPNTHLLPRSGTEWNGDWVSSFSWLRRDKGFQWFPGDPLIDSTFVNVIPEYVLTDFKPADFESHVFAGAFIGWVHKPVVFLGRQRYGKGQAFFTTFRLLSGTPTSDPVRTWLTDVVIQLAKGVNDSNA